MKHLRTGGRAGASPCRFDIPQRMRSRRAALTNPAAAASAGGSPAETVRGEAGPIIIHE